MVRPCQTTFLSLSLVKVREVTRLNMASQFRVVRRVSMVRVFMLARRFTPVRQVRMVRLVRGLAFELKSSS